MEVNIADIVSTIRTVDDATLSSPQAMERLLQMMIQALNEREMHRERVRAEQAVTGGVRANLGYEDR